MNPFQRDQYITGEAAPGQREKKQSASVWPSFGVKVVTPTIQKRSEREQTDPRNNSCTYETVVR